MTKRLPVGVIGVGSLGRHHVRHFASLPDVQLVGLYDIDPVRATEVAASFNTIAFPDADALLAEVRAVSIAVPTAAHADVGSHALSRSVPVLMEKPLATTLAEADRLIRTAQSKGVQLQVGHIERFNGAIRAAKPYLGEVRYLESTRLAPFQPRGTDVAVVLDLMIHDLDLVLHLTGASEATDVRATGIGVLSSHVDMANARVEFANGAVASVTSNRMARERVRRMRLFQSNGYFSLDLSSGRGEFMRLRAGWHPGSGGRLEDVVESIPLEATEADALGLELASFVQAVRGGGETGVSGTEGRAALALALRVSEAVQRSPVLQPGT